MKTQVEVPYILLVSFYSVILGIHLRMRQYINTEMGIFFLAHCQRVNHCIEITILRALVKFSLKPVTGFTSSVNHLKMMQWYKSQG